MRKITVLMLAAAFVCSMGMLSSCSKEGNEKKEIAAAAEEQAPERSAEAPAEVVSTELLRTNQSWNGAELPDYPDGKPELVAVKYVVPPGAKLGWHHHTAMNHGVLVKGELTIIGLDGKSKVLKEGEVVVEMVGEDAVHRGENRGTEPVVLYVFYITQEGMPLSVQHPDIPLE